MKKIIKTISRAVQVVLLAPIKLPAKAMQVLKYVAVGLGIVESVLDKEEEDKIGSAGASPRKEEDDEATE